MKSIIGHIQREKDFDYRIDREGNIIKESYNWLRDWRTYMMLIILILAGAYLLDHNALVEQINNLLDRCPNLNQITGSNYIDMPNINIFESNLTDV